MPNETPGAVSTDSLTITNASPAPIKSLEQEATEMGIDVANLDTTSEVQTAKPAEAKLLGKFESVDALAAAYAELEKKLGEKAKPEVKEEVQPTEQPATDDSQKSVEEQAQEAVENAGLNFEELSTKYWSNGEKLDDADYELLEKANIPRSLVDQFIEGQKAVVQMQRQSVFSEVGGEDKYNSMLQWAAANYTESEVEAYNRAVHSNDMKTVMLAVKGLQGRYEAKVGFEPERTVGGRTQAVLDKYESMAQLMEDMRNPKYNKDAAFRAKVEAKLGRSDIM